MKLIASALAAASAFAFVPYAEGGLKVPSADGRVYEQHGMRLWTSHSNFQACKNDVCTEKFYTVTDRYRDEQVDGDKVADICASIGAFPWCPESEEESIAVYANMAVLEYTEPHNGRFDPDRWMMEGISKWIGVEVDPAFNGSDVISNYVCPNPLQNSNGIETFFWNSDLLDESIFNNEIVQDLEDQVNRCVAIGPWRSIGELGERGEIQFKWDSIICGVSNYAFCVTTDDKSSDVGYTEMNMDASEIIKDELRQFMNRREAEDKFNRVIMFFILPLFSFCCCFCVCCKLCRSGDSAPVVTQTTQVQQQATPAPQQHAAPPAAAPMMPAYAPAMPQAAPYNPYAQPMIQPQQPMGGLNLNISNNNTNSNK